jgi:hypothetical protein
LGFGFWQAPPLCYKSGVFWTIFGGRRPRKIVQLHKSYLDFGGVWLERWREKGLGARSLSRQSISLQKILFSIVKAV